MINFDYLEQNLDALRVQYLTAQPFPYLIIDGFCNEEKLQKAYANVPELNNKSRDYGFAGNKFEKSNYKEICPEFLELYNDLASERFNKILAYITAKKTVDTGFMKIGSQICKIRHVLQRFNFI